MHLSVQNNSRHFSVGFHSYNWSELIPTITVVSNIHVYPVLIQFSIWFSFPAFSVWICQSSLWSTVRTRFWDASFIDNNLNTHTYRWSSTEVVWIRKIFVGIIAWQQLILATCFPRYYIVMRAERPILLRFLNVLNKFKWFYY